MSKGLVQLLKKSSVLMVARIIGGGMAFAVNIMIARWFGAEALGEFALSMAVASLVAVLLPTGMQSVGVMFVSQYRTQQHAGLIRGFIGTGYKHIAIMSALFAGVLALAATFFLDSVEPTTLLIVGFSFLIAPALALINFSCSILTGFKQQVLGLMPDLLIKPALMFVAIAVLGFAVSGTSSLPVMTLICGCTWLTAIGQLMLMRRALKGTQATPDTSQKALWRKASLPWIAITLMWDYFIELHLILAGLLMEPGKIGLLHVCFRLRVLAGFGVRALYSLVMPDIYAADAKGDQAGFERGLAKANILTLSYSLCVCAAMLVVGEFILGLVNESFRDGYAMLLLVCVAMVPRAVFGPTTLVMAMKGLQVPVVWILALGIVISLLLCLLMVPVYGAIAIAVAYLASSTFIAAFQWLWAKKKTGIDCSIFASANLLLLRQKLALPLNRA